MVSVRKNFVGWKGERFADQSFHCDGMTGLADHGRCRVWVLPNLATERRHRSEFLTQGGADVFRVHAAWLSCHKSLLNQAPGCNPALFCTPCRVRGTRGNDVRIGFFKSVSIVKFDLSVLYWG